MVKRNLTGDEKVIAEKQLVRIEVELKHLEWLEEYNNLMLNKGLHMNYLEKVREFKKNGMQLSGDIKVENEKIKILKGQIRSGVKVKSKVIDVEESDKGALGVG